MQQRKILSAIKTMVGVFDTFGALPGTFDHSQCVAYESEILICGGANENSCYSFHTVKNEYKRICSYPDEIRLNKHCVVKIAENADGIRLLSFGGANKHTLYMDYVSIWSDDQDENATKKKNSYNVIGKSRNNLEKVRGVIGGSKNHLLFIAYSPDNIDVLELNTLQCLKQKTLPVEDVNTIVSPCLVLKRWDGLEVANEKKSEMLLFSGKTGLSITYDEDTNDFAFDNVRVCTTIRSIIRYAYVCVNDNILFFGGQNSGDKVSRAVYKYSMSANTWMHFEHVCSRVLYDSVAVVSADNVDIHMFGRSVDYNFDTTPTEDKDCNFDITEHIMTKVHEWMKQPTEYEKQWIKHEEEIQELEEIKQNFDEIQHDFPKKN
ncbi:hypothetical protein RFI_18408 [Reticulomyxa filosa]|uniref:Kelch motif family protein n=1 Tax=Reticulomyxa filosa TaxID=46433 RepID=X6MXS6_RETFI|nr:hypothetical protein RFI_18408 [Reticulomyxa filosa]|eukprot:ETO18835.1 hypothetical protein RFI_18408 [Reticulomyxa filosa]